MKNRNRLFKEFNEYQAEHPLSRQLPYWDFLDDLVVLSDGTVGLALKLNGVSIETWDGNRINRLVEDLRAVLNGLPDGLELTFASEMNSDYASVIAEHEGLKGDNPNIRWIAEARVEAMISVAKAKKANSRARSCLKRI